VTKCGCIGSICDRVFRAVLGLNLGPVHKIRPIRARKISIKPFDEY